MGRLELADDLVRLSRLSPASALTYIGKADSTFDQINAALTPTVVCLASDQEVDLSKYEDALEIKYVGYQQLFSDKGEAQAYFVANNPAQSGLVRPESLRTYWQNLQTIEETTVETVTVDRFITDTRSDYSDFESPNWLVINCLSAGRILAGASELLSSLDAIVVKALLAEPESDDLHDSTAAHIEELLTPFGFLKFSTIPTRHGAFGHVTFMRDWKTGLGNKLVNVNVRVEQVESELATAQEASAAYQVEIAQLVERVIELERLQPELATAQEANTDYQTEISKLGERVIELERLEPELAASQEANTTYQTEISKLGERVAELERLKPELAAAQEANTTYQAEISKLGEDIKAFHQSQSLVETELKAAKRAEARAEKRQILSENNLQNLQTRYQVLAEEYAEQNQRFGLIGAELRAASQHTKPSPPTIAKTKSKPRA